jgi:hypothetical protein
MDSGGHIAAYVLGVIFIVLSLLLLANKESRIAATVIGLIYLLCVLILHTQKFNDIVHDGVGRTRAFEPFAMAGAAFALAALFAKGSTSIPFLSGATPFLAILGRYIVAFSLIVFGVQHFLYAQFIAFWFPRGCLRIFSGVLHRRRLDRRRAGDWYSHFLAAGFHDAGTDVCAVVHYLHVPRALAAMHTAKTPMNGPARSWPWACRSFFVLRRTPRRAVTPSRCGGT